MTSRVSTKAKSTRKPMRRKVPARLPGISTALAPAARSFGNGAACEAFPRPLNDCTIGGAWRALHRGLRAWNPQVCLDARHDSNTFPSALFSAVEKRRVT